MPFSTSQTVYYFGHRLNNDVMNHNIPKTRWDQLFEMIRKSERWTPTNIGQKLKIYDYKLGDRRHEVDLSTQQIQSLRYISEAPEIITYPYFTDIDTALRIKREVLPLTDLNFPSTLGSYVTSEIEISTFCQSEIKLGRKVSFEFIKGDVGHSIKLIFTNYNDAECQAFFQTIR